MITCEGIISYPNIFKPTPNQSGVLKYSCSLLVDKKDVKGVEALKDAIAKAIEKGRTSYAPWKGKVPNFRYQSLRDGDAELASGDKEDKIYAGKVFINTSMDAGKNPQGPGVVDKHGKPLMDQGDLYAGCIVRLDVNAFPYTNSGNSGVGWGLNNIMVVRDGERLDGRSKAEDAFASFAQTDANLE